MDGETSRRPGYDSRAATNNSTVGETTASIPARYDVLASLRRRRAAARRLPPLRCGCVDPLDRRHLEDRCRWVVTRWVA